MNSPGGSLHMCARLVWRRANTEESQGDPVAAPQVQPRMRGLTLLILLPR